MSNEEGHVADEKTDEQVLAERVEMVFEKTGYRDEDEPPVLEHEGLTYGDRIRAIEDDEDEGVFAGDEGFAIITTVGAPEHRNERVWVGMLADGFDSPVEVRPDAIEQAG